MPASHKMIKSRQQAANRAAGVGDEQGRIPMRVKATEVSAACTLCQQAIRMTKKNIEAKSHFEAKHPTSTFAACFPGQFDPTAPAVAASDSLEDAAASAPSAPKKKPAQDLSFLDAALDSKAAKKK